MEKLLRETKPRGSFLFPFELYHTEDSLGTYYVSPHWHQDLEIIHLQKGQIQLFIDGVSYQPAENTIIFINREELHHLNCLAPGVLYDALVFPLEFLSFDTLDYCQQKYLLPLIQKHLVFPRFINSGHPCYAPIKQQLEEIEKLHTTFPLGYQLATKTALFQILTCLVQQNCLIAAADSVMPLNSKKVNLLREVSTYLENQVIPKISLEEAAAHFYMSPNYFCKFFKKNFGCTYTNYLNRLRLEKACRMLTDTALPIMEISLLCGFDNLSYFNRLFREKKGVTPSEYRRQIAL